MVLALRLYFTTENGCQVFCVQLSLSIPRRKTENEKPPTGLGTVVSRVYDRHAMLLPQDSFEAKLFSDYKISVYRGNSDHGSPRIVSPFTHESDVINTICQRPWSHILWKKKYRKGVNFLKVELMVLDFDEKRSLDWAYQTFKDYQHVIAPTQSHGKNGEDRFRLVIPWEESITDPKVYSYNIEQAIKLYGADKACKCTARFWKPSKFLYSLAREGACMPVAPLPPQVPVAKRPPRLDHPVIVPLWLVRAIANDTWSPGHRNRNVFKYACALADFSSLNEASIIEYLQRFAQWSPGEASEFQSTIQSALRRTRGS